MPGVRCRHSEGAIATEESGRTSEDGRPAPERSYARNPACFHIPSSVSRLPISVLVLLHESAHSIQRLFKVCHARGVGAAHVTLAACAEGISGNYRDALLL